MNAIGWNCRGVGSSRTVRVLKEMIKSHKPDLLFLSETLAVRSKIEILASKLGFVNFFSVDKQGRGGGLAVFWKHNIICSVCDYSLNHIDIIVKERRAGDWRLTCFYGFPERERRQASWDFLRHLSATSQLPWCVFGDFNDLLYSGDKKGKHKHPQNLMDGFRSAVEDSSLIELELKEGDFTWEKSRGTTSWVREKLDRCFATSSWWSKFPLCTLKVFSTTVSDHDPIKIEMTNTSISKKQFRFRFENSWLKEPNFQSEVTKYWQNLPTMHLIPKLLELSTYMAKWGREFFNKFREKIVKQKKVIADLKDREDDDGIQEYFEANDRLNDLLIHEEAYWQQRAKNFWLKEGDMNSKFFHAAASSRKKLNHISGLKAEDGTLVTSHEEMCSLLENYYKKVFLETGSVVDQSIQEVDIMINNRQNEMLTTDLSFSEFTQAVKSMHPDKASGPDGFNPAFFQHFWELLGKEVFRCCQQWLIEGKFPNNVNDTTLVLIPKKDQVDDPKDLRPIALCNVLYKIMAKVLANRLLKILPGVISEEQSAFVPGRSITDNVLVAFELLHYMKRKNSGQEGVVALKLDISKAYDRVSWNYLQNKMRSMGFAEKWIKWIMICVTTVSYNISFQGSMIGPINPTRGLRQGDPLSPYLFLLCVEGLSKSLKVAAQNGSINGCCICASAPAITHLLFADDSFLFFKSNITEAAAVKRILNDYEVSSGQAVNYQKSAIFFSSNVRRDKQEEIKQELGVFKEIGDSKYLGLPSLIGRSKKVVFRYLKDRIIQKIKGWSSRLLSRAGKLVMLKNVLQAIPTYTMSCFLIPKSICQEIQKTMNAYWWQTQSSSTKGIKWLGWNRMCMSKDKGGLGFRDMHGFNLALLGKQCWKLIHEPNALVSRVMKARYYPNSHFLQASRTGGVSYTWSGLWEAKEELRKGMRWVIGDGKTINIASDRWLRSKDDFCINRDQCSNQVLQLKASDLFRDNIKVWDEDKVRLHFCREDAEAILNTRIPQGDTRDRVAWIHSNNGKYTVKSGYYQWCQNHPSNEEIQQSDGWSRIWKIEVPHKIRVFLWRFCRNTLPVRFRLRGRGVRVPIGCSLCTGDIEHLRHVFFECHFAKECWQQTGLRYDLWEMENSHEWLLDTLATGSPEDLIKIATVLWGVWFARNKYIFENKKMSPSATMNWSASQISEWQITNRKSVRAIRVSSSRQMNDSKWQHPATDSLKLNVDASVAAGQQSFSLGMVLRNHKGEYVTGKVMRCAGLVPVIEAELTGIAEALDWAQHVTEGEVVVESDSLLSVNAIKNGQENLLEVGDLLKKCKDSLRANERLKVSFARRQANQVAHRIARIPCELNSFVVFSSPPNMLLETILSESLKI